MNQYTLVSEPTRLEDLQPGQSGWIRPSEVLMLIGATGPTAPVWAPLGELVWPAMISPLPDDPSLRQDVCDEARGQIKRAVYVSRSDQGYELVYPDGKDVIFVVVKPSVPCITLTGRFDDISKYPGACAELLAG